MAGFLPRVGERLQGRGRKRPARQDKLRPTCARFRSSDPLVGCGKDAFLLLRHAEAFFDMHLPILARRWCTASGKSGRRELDPRADLRAAHEVAEVAEQAEPGADPNTTRMRNSKGRT